MKNMRVRLTMLEETLGMMPSDKDICETYIAGNAPDAKSMAEEIEAIGVEAFVEKQKTIFPKMADGTPFFWDYQLRGMFKDSIGMLRKIPNSPCSKLKAYKKAVDGLLFVKERRVLIHTSGPMGDCQRPIRTSGPSGERVALAHSETVPAGSYIEFTIEMWTDDLEPVVRQCLDYGTRRGLGQWRNSGKGIFEWEEIDEGTGNVIGGNRSESVA